MGETIKKRQDFGIIASAAGPDLPDLPTLPLPSHIGGLGPRNPGTAPREAAQLGAEQSWTAVCGATTCTQEISPGSWGCTAHCRGSPR